MFFTLKILYFESKIEEMEILENRKSNVESLTCRTQSSNRVPLQPGVTKASADPTSRVRVGSTSGFRIAIPLCPTGGLYGQNPQQFHSRRRPPAHRQSVIQIHEAPVRLATRIPDSYPVRRCGSSCPERTTQRGVDTATPGRAVDVHVAEAVGGAV